MSTEETKSYEPPNVQVLSPDDPTIQQPSNSLPPKPMPIWDYTEEENKAFECITEDVADEQGAVKNLFYRMIYTWGLYGSIVNQPKIAEIVQSPADKDSNEFALQVAFVQIADQLAKILARGNFLKELQLVGGPAPLQPPTDAPTERD